jgi:uncharacterized membrane protein
MADMIRGFILTIAASIALTTSARAELTLCNRTSYRMDVALGLEKARECRNAWLVPA